MRERAGLDAFRDLAGGYDSWFESPLGSFVGERQLASLRRSLTPLPPGSQVVEIGAGTGQISRFLAARGYRVLAVEPSKEMLRAAALPDRAEDAYWVRAVAEALPLVSGSIAAAVLFTTLEFVQDPRTALAEARRVVRPGGLLIVGFLDALSSWTARYRSEADHGEDPWTAARFFTLADVEGLVGLDPEFVESAVFLAPDAAPPFDEADDAGRRAGNHGAATIARWRMP